MATGASGTGGDVRLGTSTPVQVCEVTKWSFNPKANNSSYASNCSGGYKRRVKGTKEGSGTIEGKWDPAAPITDVLEEGEEVTLNLHTTATQKWVVPAMIDSIKLDVDMDSGEVIGWSADFSSNGAWTKPVAGAFAPQFPTGGDDQGVRRVRTDPGEMPMAMPRRRTAASSTRAEDAHNPALDVEAITAAVTAAVLAAMKGNPAFSRQAAPAAPRRVAARIAA